MSKILICFSGDEKACIRSLAANMPEIIIRAAQANGEELEWNGFSKRCLTSNPSTDVYKWLSTSRDLIIRHIENRGDFLSFVNFIYLETPFLASYDITDTYGCVIVEPANEYDLERYDLL